MVIGPCLTIPSAVLFRTINAFVVYLLLSLTYTLVNLAFGISLGTVYGAGGGFFAFWMLSFFAIAAVGLPMESLFTLIGLKWAGYFLTFWLIVNVSGSFTSFELMPGFFKYGYAIPFFNAIQGTRTILFGTRSHLGVNFGVLAAWIVVGWAGLAVMTVIQLRKNRKEGVHQLR